ncbi:extracellular solute-binding protein [Carnobacteriaceae bacterium zg-ZUI78]|uniref:sugar ABC transporter substrate-binding protein n=1 Tax=Granulicatella sp. zg-84 TaxID=2678503 RepID=UPI0013C21ABD|nr:extracellular solute-binding protein [Granulicatella sp. zg-84]MBS4750497.1 extracellular solute-binding protein [Carnobacteriaceae bacterium zg-ZUI78]NEW66108.1 extracellular solute-binding protein [Granulicatella sp. zg-84]QMI85451.1 extracellular solute-binding protein [Carnobacteriaceae bacterium zg-84]
MRKIMSYIGAISATVMLAACGNGAQNTSNKTESESSGTKSEITYAIWDSGQEKGLRKIADKFEEKNKDIKVKIQVVNWDAYWTMLEAGATGGTLPDTFWMHSNEIYRYGSNNMLLGLDDYLAKSKDAKLENFPEGLNKIYNVGGKQYAVPKDYDTIGLWYNKKMFDEAGVAYPDESWDWNKLYEVAKKLTKEDGSQYGFLAPLHNQEGFYNFIYQNDGTVITPDKKSGYDNPKTIQALEYYMRFVKEKLSPEITDDKKRAEALQNGQVAMALFGSWNLSSFNDNEYIKNNFDIAVLPKGNTGKRVTIFNGLGNAISANTKHKEASWKWVEFLSSKEGQDMQASLGVAISAYKGAATTWVDSNKNFHIKSFIDMVDDAQIRPYSNSTSKWEEKSYELLKPAYLGQKTVEEACKDVAKMMNEELSSEK